MARRILSLWLPRLASEMSLRRRPHEGPFALTQRAGNADHLHCLNPAAERAGLWRGMPLVDAHAICPGLATRPADLVAEGAFLQALRRWALRYSPLVARDGADGILADITGVAHLFGGEEALRHDMATRLARAGITACAAVADTRGAAHAMARHGGGIAPPGALLAHVGRLPIAALRVDAETVVALERLGLKCIRDLTRVPRAPLARRMGAALMLRLDQALGVQPEPVSPEAEPPHYGVRLTLPEPIGLVSDVQAGLTRLLDRLCATLAANHHGARRVRLEMRRVDRGVVAAEIRFARPMNDAPRMATLFADAVQDIDAGFGIDQLRLSAPVTEPLAPRQMDAPHQIGADKLTDLVTRLGNRLGFGAVQRMLPAESHIPEKSFLVVPAAYADPAEDWPPHPERPLLIFPPEPIEASGAEPPSRFRWRRMSFTTARATGPERIAPEWWLDDPDWRQGLRDYWKIETREGRRLWLFHTPQSPGWCVQGEFA
jgi:protein ImuB